MDSRLIRTIVIVLAVVGAIVVLGSLAMVLGCGMMGCGGMMNGMMG